MVDSLLHELQAAQGAVVTAPDAPPTRFGDPAAEARAAHESAALFDLSGWSLIEIAGADRLSFLHNFCTSDIKSLTPGTGCEAFLTNIKGRILGHILVCAHDDILRLISVPGSAAGIVDHLDRYLITEVAEIRDVTTQVATLNLVGPRAAPVASDQLGIDAGILGMYGNVRAPSGIDIIRVPFAEPPAFLLSTAAAAVGELWQHLTSAGVQPAGSDVWNSLRITAGFPLYGVDISDENIAQEAGRTARTISFTKGCYLGQEPIARLDALGHVNRILCRLRLGATEVVSPGADVFNESGDQRIGAISSSAVNHLTGNVVALGILQAKFSAPQSTVSIRTADDVLITGTVLDSIE